MAKQASANICYGYKFIDEKCLWDPKCCTINPSVSVFNANGLFRRGLEPFRALFLTVVSIIRWHSVQLISFCSVMVCGNHIRQRHWENTHSDVRGQMSVCLQHHQKCNEAACMAWSPVDSPPQLPHTPPQGPPSPPFTITAWLNENGYPLVKRDHRPIVSSFTLWPSSEH